jgi:hypothetical protein
MPRSAISWRRPILGDDSEEIRTGSQVGNYVLREPIAEGGMGKVYRAVRVTDTSSRSNAGTMVGSLSSIGLCPPPGRRIRYRSTPYDEFGFGLFGGDLSLD